MKNEIYTVPIIQFPSLKTIKASPSYNLHSPFMAANLLF